MKRWRFADLSGAEKRVALSERWLYDPYRRDAWVASVEAREEQPPLRQPPLRRGQYVEARVEGGHHALSRSRGMMPGPVSRRL